MFVEKSFIAHSNDNRVFEFMTEYVSDHRETVPKIDTHLEKLLLPRRFEVLLHCQRERTTFLD